MHGGIHHDLQAFGAFGSIVDNFQLGSCARRDGEGGAAPIEVGFHSRAVLRCGEVADLGICSHLRFGNDVHAQGDGFRAVVFHRHGEHVFVACDGGDVRADVLITCTRYRGIGDVHGICFRVRVDGVARQAEVARKHDVGVVDENAVVVAFGFFGDDDFALLCKLEVADRDVARMGG